MSKTKKLGTMINKTLRKDDTLKHAAFTIKSEALDIDLSITSDYVDDLTKQPFYFASVGKLYTATLIGILHEQKKLKFDDPITMFLPKKTIENLHIKNGIDSSKTITIKHLLKQRSGLDDAFWSLMDDLKSDSSLRLTTDALIDYVKEFIPPKHDVDKKIHYTDTNYYLLGLIIEKITTMSFHDAIHKYIFEPLKMEHSYLLHKTESKKDTLDTVPFTINDVRGDLVKGYADVDFAGGSIVATLPDMQKFLDGLINHVLINEDTLQLMINDSGMMYPGINYGYSIWSIAPTPILIPKKYFAWGGVGVLGSFVFYHPLTKTKIIGSFNNTKYERKCIRFVMKLIKELNK